MRLKTLMFVASLASFAGAAKLFFVEDNWYGAFGWFIAGYYQFFDGMRDQKGSGDDT